MVGASLTADGDMDAPRNQQTMSLRDGRRLGHAQYGAPDGAPVFYFHGTPGSRLEGQFAHEAAARLGVRVIALDRPGYGLSDFEPHRTILDWPRDVEQVADALGLHRFSVLGSSGGGPYALACAHEFPRRITRTGVVSGAGPHFSPGADQHLRWQNRVVAEVGARFPPAAQFLAWSLERRVRLRPEPTVDTLLTAMSPDGTGVVRRPDVRRAVAANMVEAFRQGSHAVAREIVLAGRPWGFRLDGIKPLVFLWQGEADVVVRPGVGRYLAAQIPDCRATFFPSEGHMILIDHIAEIVQALASPVGMETDREH